MPPYRPTPEQLNRVLGIDEDVAETSAPPVIPKSVAKIRGAWVVAVEALQESKKTGNENLVFRIQSDLMYHLGKPFAVAHKLTAPDSEEIQRLEDQDLRAFMNERQDSFPAVYVETFVSSVGDITHLTSVNCYCIGHGVEVDPATNVMYPSVHRMEDFLDVGRGIGNAVRPDTEEWQTVLDTVAFATGANIPALYP